jgi:RHS repeat-associated protein
VSDNGYVSTYLYDASGERTVKLSGDGEGMTVNGRLSGGRTGTEGFTAYVNPYVVIANGSRLSKHIYAGSQRIVSKLCASGSSLSNPLTITKAAEGVVNYTAKYTALKTSVAARYDSLGLPFLGTDHAGSGFWTSTPTTRETDQYFYHPDHLGSSSLITTLDGVLAQHLEYLPFGEVFVDERATPTTRSTPYKFNAKELDEETGLYYYSARYMDPRLSLWLSVDPLAEKYPGFGSYIYCRNNPVRLIDPDGRSDEESSGKPAKLQANGVMSTAQSSIRTEPPQRLTNLRNSPEPYGGEIKRADMFSTFESWLNKPSESIMEAVGKITLNIAYSMGNSPFSLLTGRTIGGKSLNSEEKIQSFIDVVPLGVIEGLKISGTVVNTTNKGISGFNKFKESIGPISSKDLPTGMKWQENASQLYKSNKTQSQSLNDFDKFVNAIGFSDVVKSEINK